ncbi:hypothetical protein GGR32_000123 [Mesonia hippocampi]|uniref:Uncharacterized protein n=1 Tax=Mesonia hippocampi TaxID=1628250 RepID=A0A840EL78_9FLAO|nr:hypothetical protein [Mesonia hippocampi]MBB4117851.1 hypothetical protein [Mesonia hippocampi]
MAISNKTYQLNFSYLILHELPTLLRQPKWYAWLFALLKPSQNLHIRFLNYRKETNYKLDHTPQVFSLENVLNDYFDPQERRIYITDGIYLSPIYFYNPEENAPVHFYNPEENKPVHFYNPEELEQLDVDFVVVLPLEFQNIYTEGSSQIIRLKAYVDFYRLPDKTYNITFK